MGIEQKILVRGASLGAGVASLLCALLALTACGQKGALYMPNDPEFKQRATLPEIVRRQLPSPPATAPAASSPASAASASGR
jgi:hypothetical protein